MNFKSQTRFVHLFLLLALGGATARAESPAALSVAETRKAFLAIIDRAKVDLAPQVTAEPIERGLAGLHFVYSSEAGQRVPGIMSFKEGLDKDGARHPVVIVAHGTGGKKESNLGLMKKLAARGFIAVAIDGRFHGERGDQAGYNDAIAKAFEGSGAHPLYYDTVWDLMRLIDYLQTRPDVDAARIGLIGFSKGGIETWLAAAVDERIAVAIPCIGVQSFEWALENDAWGPRVATIKKGFTAAAKSAGVDKPDAAFVRRFYDRVLPGIYDRFDSTRMLPAISPRALLTINGETDDKNPLPGLKLATDAAEAAYAKAGAPDKFQHLIEKGVGHNVNAAASAAAVEWFVKWLKPM